MDEERAMCSGPRPLCFPCRAPSPAGLDKQTLPEGEVSARWQAYCLLVHPELAAGTTRNVTCNFLF